MLGGLVRPPKEPPMLREWDGAHGKPDVLDVERIRLVRGRWDQQTSALLKRDRMIEENVRFLAGRQWDVWSNLLGQFVEPTRYLSDTERQWRQRPVVNLLQYWFMLTHARVTETPPVITFQPASADRMDANLADTMDTIFKTLWSGELEMDQRFPEAASWLIAAGEVYMETCSEYGRNAAQYMLQAPATLSMTPEDGSEAITRETGGPVPYSAQGNPLASLVPEGDDYGFQVPDFGQGYEGEQPAYVKEGTPKVRVYSPLEVRSEWGANIPWSEKRWVICQRFLSTDQIQELYGVDVKPDTVGQAGDISGGAGYLQRMLFGAGSFGAPSRGPIGDDTPTGEYVSVWSMWEKPTQSISPESEDEPGGRLLVVTPTEVLHDSTRPYKTKGAGPIQRAQFVQMPGRAGQGSTPLEQLVPLQKTYNRGWAQMLEHRNRCTNPTLVYDFASGFDAQMSNLPGSMVGADFTHNSQPAYFLAPPPLSGDVYKIQEMIFQVMFTLGGMAGAEGSPPTDDPSGELVAQLRFNSDRPVMTAVRSLAEALAGIGDDLVAILPTCWPVEKIIAYAGDDNVLRTIQVLPEMWDGRVNVRPDITSAVPESQPARQARLERLWMAGAFGDPLMQGRKIFLELANFPNMSRAFRMDGGVDRVTCERMLTEIGQGMQVGQILQQLGPWYNYDVFLDTTRNHLAAPEFRDYDPPVQQQLALFFETLLNAKVQSAQLQASVAAPMLEAQAAVQGNAARVAQENGPQDESLTAGGPKQSGPQPRQAA